MDAATALLNTARRLAADAENRQTSLEAEFKEVEARYLQIQAERHKAGLAAKRFLKFEPRAGSQYQCPRCWIDHEIRSPLTSIPGTDDYNVLRCHACKADWEIPLNE